MPSARAIAMTAGLSHYNTGKPCKHGHNSHRRVTNGACLACDREAKRADFSENPEKYRARNAVNNAANRERNRAYCVAWRKGNPAAAVRHTAARRARKAAAIPADFSDFDAFVIEEAAAACKRREAMHGERFEVDHMIPLVRGGLHCATNLQVIPARLNRSKSGKMVFTKPLQWLDAIAPRTV